MGEPAFTDNLATAIDQTDLVRLACPVDAGKPLNIFCHHSPFVLSPPGHRDASSFPVLALLARLPTGCASRPNPPRHVSPPGAQDTGGHRLLSTGWPGPSSLKKGLAHGHAQRYRGRERFRKNQAETTRVRTGDPPAVGHF